MRHSSPGRQPISRWIRIIHRVRFRDGLAWATARMLSRRPRA
jgi:hypothetical protein